MTIGLSCAAAGQLRATANTVTAAATNAFGCGIPLPLIVVSSPRERSRPPCAFRSPDLALVLGQLIERRPPCRHEGHGRPVLPLVPMRNCIEIVVAKHAGERQRHVHLLPG